MCIFSLLKFLNISFHSISLRQKRTSHTSTATSIRFVYRWQFGIQRCCARLRYILKSHSVRRYRTRIVITFCIVCNWHRRLITCIKNSSSFHIIAEVLACSHCWRIAYSISKTSTACDAPNWPTTNIRKNYRNCFLHF